MGTLRGSDPVRRVLIVCVAVAVIFPASACDSSPDSKPSAAVSASRSTSASPSLNARQQAEAQAIAAYNGLWQAMARAQEIPDPDAPDLRRFAEGDALALVVGALQSSLEEGVVSRGAPVTNPHVTSATPTEVPVEIHLLDCGDSSNWIEYWKSTGKPVENDPRGRRRITAEVHHRPDGWKVSSFDIGDIGSC